MKITTWALGTLLSLAMLGAAAPANAQTFEPVTGYGTLGYSDLNGGQLNLGAITGRLGARFGSYLGVEGELSVGVNEHNFTYFPPCIVPICALPIFRLRSRLNSSESIYAVGYLPLTPDADLFVRAGYGAADYSSSTFFSRGFSQQTFNIGAGGQYFFDGVDGVRLDYTREDITQNDQIGREATGSGVDVWSISYVRRF